MIANIMDRTYIGVTQSRGSTRLTPETIKCHRIWRQDTGEEFERDDPV